MFLLSGCVTNHVVRQADWGGLVYSQQVAKPTELKSLTYLGVY